MYMWLGLWVGVVLCEILLYSLATNSISRNRVYRSLSVAVIALVALICDVMLIAYGWWFWLLPALIAPYRFINLARFLLYRLQPKHLRVASLRALVWLVSVQLVVALVVVLLSGVSLSVVLGCLAALQFGVLLALLRVSLQTWEHISPGETQQHYSDKELPSLSVLVPARDETQSLLACLQSLVESDYPKLEIIVLDDCSIERRTPEIIRGFAHEGVRFVAGTTPPDNWIARNYANSQLVKEASGQLLVFCGVDTTFEPSSLRAMVETMLDRNAEMISMLPLRSQAIPHTSMVLQTTRYFWELCLPRRVFKRPPVLSTCWVIRANTLEAYGGFEAASQSVAPEAYFAKRAVAEGCYSFVGSHARLTVYTAKTFNEQFKTSVRLRYPQLHRRLELVAMTAWLEVFIFISPFVGMVYSLWLPHMSGFFAIWFACASIITLMYGLVAIKTRLVHTWIALVTPPIAFLIDITVLHISMLRYEFGSVDWKGRNVCLPIMKVESRLPSLPD